MMRRHIGPGASFAFRVRPAAPKRKKLSRFATISKQVATVAAIVTGLTTLAGAAMALWQFAWRTETERKAEDLRELTTFGSYAEIVRKDRDVTKLTNSYMATVREHGPLSPVDLEDLLTRYKTGLAIYEAPEFESFRTIHEFYEELGLQVSRGALDFDLVFQLVTYPSDFAKATRALCTFIGANWFGRGSGIYGMCENQFDLGERYDKQRAEHGVKPASDSQAPTLAAAVRDQ